MNNKKNISRNIDHIALMNELVSIFSAELDSHNIVLKIYEILEPIFHVDALAIMLCDPLKNDLIVASEAGFSRSAVKQVFDHIKREHKELRDVNEKDVDFFDAHFRTSGKKISKYGSFISKLVFTKTNLGAMVVLIAKRERAFTLGIDDILDLLARQLAFFIENEKIRIELINSKNRFESMIHSMSEGVVSMNEKNEVLLVNQSAKMLLNATDVKEGIPLPILTKADAWPSVAREIMQSEENFIKSHDLEFCGEKKCIKFFVAPVADSLGNNIGKIVLLTDISKEKEIDRMKSEFVSTTSHELRTPLAAIKESVSLVLDGIAGSVTPSQEKFLTLAKRNIDRLATLINNLLDLSKIDTGKLMLERETYPVSKLIETALTPLDLLAKRGEVILKSSMSENLPGVYCDPSRIVQVITNLVGNALKFTPAGGLVTVTAKVSKDQKEFVEFSVKDTGPGISQADTEKLFQRFQQLDGSITRQFGGTGLGLSISKELVEMHGGKIWAESRIGKGTEFKFLLPVK